jgi:hypothetical protein
MDWFMGQVDQGYFHVLNPFNNRVSKVSALPESVHTVVFWSKNFGPFINEGYADRLRAMGYNLFFNFTINSRDVFLEPNVPVLKDRLKQLKALCRQVLPESIQWRFDPICFYGSDGSPWQDNLADFERIADVAARLGVKRCITSFVDDYGKIRKRLARTNGISFFEPPMEKKVEVLCHMDDVLAKRQMALLACCEKDVLGELPQSCRVRASACIPNDLLVELFGGHISLKSDPGQRIHKGCGCKMSRDVGSYQLHPCFHNCLFCYANPSGDPLAMI